MYRVHVALCQNVLKTYKVYNVLWPVLVKECTFDARDFQSNDSKLRSLRQLLLDVSLNASKNYRTSVITK